MLRSSSWRLTNQSSSSRLLPEDLADNAVDPPAASTKQTTSPSPTKSSPSVFDDTSTKLVVTCPTKQESNLDSVATTSDNRNNHVENPSTNAAVNEGTLLNTSKINSSSFLAESSTVTPRVPTNSSASSVTEESPNIKSDRSLLKLYKAQYPEATVAELQVILAHDFHEGKAQQKEEQAKQLCQDLVQLLQQAHDDVSSTSSYFSSRQSSSSSDDEQEASVESMSVSSMSSDESSLWESGTTESVLTTSATDIGDQTSVVSSASSPARLSHEDSMTVVTSNVGKEEEIDSQTLQQKQKELVAKLDQTYMELERTRQTQRRLADRKYRNATTKSPKRGFWNKKALSRRQEARQERFFVQHLKLSLGRDYTKQVKEQKEQRKQARKGWWRRFGTCRGKRVHPAPTESEKIADGRNRSKTSKPTYVEQCKNRDPALDGTLHGGQLQSPSKYRAQKIGLPRSVRRRNFWKLPDEPLPAYLRKLHKLHSKVWFPDCAQLLKDINPYHSARPIPTNPVAPSYHVADWIFKDVIHTGRFGVKIMTCFKDATFVKDLQSEDDEVANAALARLEEATPENIVKIYPKSTMKPCQDVEIRRQVAFLTRFRVKQPNILHMDNWYTTPTMTCILMERYDSTLYDMREDLINDIPKAMIILKGTLDGLARLHRNGIVHLNLSPETIGIVGNGKTLANSANVKIRCTDRCQFGTELPVRYKWTLNCEGGENSPSQPQSYFCAPEQLSRDTYDGKACDLFSLATVILYTTFGINRFPWQDLYDQHDSSMDLCTNAHMVAALETVCRFMHSEVPEEEPLRRFLAKGFLFSEPGQRWSVERAKEVLARIG